MTIFVYDTRHWL